MRMISPCARRHCQSVPLTYGWGVLIQTPKIDEFRHRCTVGARFADLKRFWLVSDSGFSQELAERFVRLSLSLPIGFVRYVGGIRLGWPKVDMLTGCAPGQRTSLLRNSLIANSPDAATGRRQTAGTAVASRCSPVGLALVCDPEQGAAVGGGVDR